MTQPLAAPARFLGRASDVVAAALRGRAARLLVGLVLANLAVWVWALTAFHAYPLLLGTALLAYGLGVRHAIDADHIAAIDNVTRKMLHHGERPIGVGFFFSLGHSTVVVLASGAIAVTATALTRQFAAFHAIGSMIGTIVSALFLLAIAIMNGLVLISVYRTFHRVRAGGEYEHDDMNALLSGGGLLARLFRPLFGMIHESWHMYPLGFLFGLGFDTATEIGLLGISAAGAAKGMSLWSILVFPALFTAGMSLVDTIDSVMMASAYGWAFVKPIRKLYYNMTITFMSVIVALLVGAIEALGLIGDRLHATGAFWSGIAALNRNVGSVGYLIIGVFIASWLIAAAVYRLKRYDALDLGAPADERI